jgi:anti-sigma regulatory factor (Ser/Thr protein kinase)
MEVSGPALTIEDSSQVPDARRAATRLAQDLGFDDAGVGNVALVVTEIGTNILKHGGGGQMLLLAVREAGVDGLDVIGLDRGQGMVDVEACLRDGYSTAGSPGTGLGAVRRLSADFDVYTVPRRGAALLARLWSRRPATARPAGLMVGVAAAALAGETVSGDGWAVEQTPARTVLLLVDGLGHGLVAAEAAREAVRLFRVHATRAPAEIVGALHDGLRATRGAAAAVTEICAEHRVVRFCGVGNIAAGVIVGSARRQFVSHNGIVGHAARKIAEFTYPWTKDSVFIQHTDGLTSHWDVAAYPSLLDRSPSLVAAVLYRDFSRPRDDVTVMVAREAWA